MADASAPQLHPHDGVNDIHPSSQPEYLDEHGEGIPIVGQDDGNGTQLSSPQGCSIHLLAPSQIIFTVFPLSVLLSRFDETEETGQWTRSKPAADICWEYTSKCAAHV